MPCPDDPHACQVSIVYPFTGESITVDRCLAPELQALRERGVRTSGCCCGHGDEQAAYIDAKGQEIMEQLGYRKAAWAEHCFPADGGRSYMPKNKSW